LLSRGGERSLTAVVGKKGDVNHREKKKGRWERRGKSMMGGFWVRSRDVLALFWGRKKRGE